MKYINNKYSKAIFYSVIYLLLFFCFERQISDILWIINSKWLNDCNQFTGGILIILLASYVMYLLHKAYKELIFSSLLMATSLSFLLMYAFYRLLDHTFSFWQIVDFGKFDIVYADILFVLAGYMVYHQIALPKNNIIESNAGKSLLNHDRPITFVDEDALNYRSIAASLVKDLKGLDLSKCSYSIGITGEWGSGKSSFFNLFVHELDDNLAIVYRFNPRSSAKLEDIQQDFFDGFASSLEPYHSGVHRLFKKYQTALQLIDDGLINKILSILPFAKDSVSKNDVNQVIDEVGRRIYVLIDDLDRLTAKELIEVMKLIDRNAGFNNTVFITAYDKEYVNEVLNNYLRISSKTDFTDKYFSYELSLPVQRIEDLNKYAVSIIHNNDFFENDDAIDKNKILKEWEQVSRQILTHLHTIRHLKRWMSILLSRYSIVRNDVVFSDFALLTLLRYKDISVYHAIVEGRLLERGSFLNSNTDRAYYLKKDYEEEVKKIAKWEYSQEILKSLFAELKNDDFQIGDKYQRLQFVSAFDNYFYDYKADEIYYKDLMALYNTEKETDVVEVLKQLIGYNQEKNTYDANKYQSVEEFLLLRKVSQLRSQADLERRLKLLLHLMMIVGRNLNLEVAVTSYLTEEMANECAEANLYGNDEHYKIEIEPVFDGLCSQFPFMMGCIMLSVNIEINEDNNNESNLIFHQKSIIKWCESCLKTFISKGGDIENVTILSKIFETKDATHVTRQASTEYINYINQNSLTFAEFILHAGRTHVTKPHMNISFRKGFSPDMFFPYEGMSFEEWLQKHVEKVNLRNILIRLVKSPGYTIDIELQKGEWRNAEKDYDAIWTVIVRTDEEQEEQLVMPAIGNHVALSLDLLAKEIKLDKGKVAKAISRLVNKNMLHESFLNLPESIARFEQGDFVKFNEGLLNNKYTPTSHHPYNVFKILEIKQGKVKLDNITELVPFKEIEAIPIDGKHDVNIYEQVYPAASYVGEGESVPAFHTDDSYYMLQFMHRRYEGKTFVEYVREKNLHFVHEVQHWLRDEFGEDHLKVRDYA